MNIVEMIARSHNGQGLDVLGQQFGLSREQTLQAVAELAPMVTAGIRKNTRQDNGMASLLEALSGGSHERYLDDPQAVQYDNARDDGNGILGHLFVDKQVSREVTMQAAGSTGIGGAIMRKMLPVIASMVIGAIFKQMTGGGRAQTPQPQGGQGGGLGDILGDILGGGQQRAPSPQPQPRSEKGGGLDDLIRDVLGGGRGQPSPQPHQRQQPQSQDGALDDLLRDILGGGKRPQNNGEVISRGRKTLDDIIGGDTKTGSGNAADDLLESVNRRLGY